MRVSLIAGIISALALIVACFLPWIEIPSKSILVTGVDPSVTNFGKPGYFHFLLSFLFLLFLLIPRVWAKRTNLFVSAVNIAWAIRNFIIISACEGGICPAKKAGLYLVLGASILMLIVAMLPGDKIKTSSPQS